MQAKIKIEIDYTDEKTRTELFKKYTPLLYKIVNQHVGNLPLEFDDIVGSAQEGFVYAMNTYKKGTSQSFPQYAGWCMRNYILSSANNEGHIVKFSAYQQKKAKESGETTFITKSISTFCGGDEEEDVSDRMSIFGADAIHVDLPDEDEVFNNLYNWVSSKFSKRDAEIFYSYYGINNHEEQKGIEIAKRLGVSSATVTVVNKKILKELKNQPLLIEQLKDLI